MIAKKPVYRTRDAPHGFWKKLHNTVRKHGLLAIPFEPAAYVMKGGDGSIQGLMVSHVDDFLWAGGPAMQAAMEAIQGELQWRFYILRTQHPANQ